MTPRQAACRKYYLKNREQILATQAEKRKNNPEPLLAAEERYRTKHRDRVRESQVTFRLRNPGKISAYAILYQQKNPLVTRLRARLSAFARKTGVEKSGPTSTVVGCSPQQLRQWLTKKFLPGMTWENRSQWHIDHTIPLSVATCTEELDLLCHYSNLQPLWAADNIRKHSHHEYATREEALAAAKLAKEAAERIYSVPPVFPDTDR